MINKFSTINTKFTTNIQNARNTYKLMFNFGYDSVDKKHHPLALNIALSVALFGFGCLIKYFVLPLKEKNNA